MGIWMDYKGEPKVVEQALRKTLAAAHNYRPSDGALSLFANIMEQLTQFRIISLGLQVLLLFIGAFDAGYCGHRADEYHAGECAASGRARLESRRPWGAEKAYPAAVFWPKRW